MIYIFKGVQGICSLPGLLCKGCGELCAQCDCGPCRECAHYASECCNDASKCVRQFMGRPLSTFVVVSFLVSVAEVYFCFQQDDDCEFTHKDALVTHAMWLNVQILFATLSLVFAPYMQAKVWWLILDEIKNHPDGPTIDPKTRKQIVPKKDVQDAFKRVFLEDFGVLFYFFASLLSLFWCFKGNKWSNGLRNSCEIDMAVDLGYLQFSMAFLYTFCWYCCPCCAKAIELDEQKEDYYDKQQRGDQDSDDSDSAA